MGCLPDVFVGPNKFIFLNSPTTFVFDFFFLDNIFFADELRWEYSKFNDFNSSILIVSLNFFNFLIIFILF